MSWDEAFSHRYDEWAAEMTADIAFYVGLAREADGPLVELAVGNGRVAIPVATGDRQARDRDRLVAGDARAGARARGRGGCRRSSCATGRHARAPGSRSPRRSIYCPFRALLHVPTWADRRRRLRASRGVAPARRTVRLERVRVRPSHRGPARRRPPGGARAAHGSLRGRRQPHRHRPRRRRDAARSGGRRGTSGSASSTSPGSSSRRSTAASEASRSTTPAREYVFVARR